MILKNSNEYEVNIINEKGEVMFTLYEGDYADIPVDVRKMIDWKIKYPDDKIIHLFDLFEDALSQVTIDLKGRPEYSYDDYNYITMNTMPHTIQ